MPMLCRSPLAPDVRHTAHKLLQASPEDALWPGHQAPIRLGLLVPFQGADAIWGPSCQYSAVLAAAELNRNGGILGRQVELFAVDAGGDPQRVVSRAWELVEEHSIDALIGVHLSSVRLALREAFAGVVPYIFAPLYEGGERTRGVFAIGDTPERQFPAAVNWLMNNRGAQRWFLVGNDYIWPRASHAAVRRIVGQAHGCIVGEEYIGLGQENIASVIEKIAQLKPDIIFESLVGSDCVMFNRAFSRAGLSRHIDRLSGAIEENTLLGIGARHTQNLYCAASYFSTLNTATNRNFMAQYRAAFGANAPIQGVLSHSCYDAIHFFSTLASDAGSVHMAALCDAFERLQGAHQPAPIYLAKAQQMSFEIFQQLD